MDTRFSRGDLSFSSTARMVGHNGGAVLIVIAILNQMMTHRKVVQAQAASALTNSMSENARQAAEVIRAQGMRKDIKRCWLTQRSAALSQSIAASDWTGSFTSLTKSLKDEQTGFTYYRADVVPVVGELEHLNGQVLLPGMSVEALIKTDERTPFLYLIKPWRTTSTGCSANSRFTPLRDSQAGSTSCPH